MTSTVATPRLGFLGVGWIGRNRLDAIVAAGAGTVAGVADPVLPESLPSLDALLERELDGVVIATPSALHAEQALRVLECGLPVFVQKPLGRDAAEVRAVVAAARRANVPLGVDLSYRHAAAFQAARGAVGAIGEVFAAELCFHNAYGPDKPWFFDPDLAGGGCLIDLGIHLVDLAVWIIGLDPDEVRGRLVGSPVETWASAELDHVHLACSWNLHAGCDAQIEARFFGTDGGVAVTNVDGSFYDFRCTRFTGRDSELLVVPPDDWPGRAAIDWARRVARGERFDADAGDELVRVAEIIDRIYVCAS